MYRLLIIVSLIVPMSAWGAEVSEYQRLTQETAKLSGLTPAEIQKQTAQHQKKYSKTFRNTPEDQAKSENRVNAMRFFNEDYNVRLEKTLIKDLRVALETQNPQLISKHVEKDVVFSKPTSLSPTPLQRTDGISINESNQLAEGQGLAAFTSEIKAYMGQFKKVDYVDVKLKASSNLKATTNNEQVILEKLPEVNSTMSVEVRGLMANGKRRVDKADVLLTLHNGDAATKIKTYKITNLQSLKLDREPAFAKAAQNAGFDKGTTYPRLEALRRGGYGFAMEDFNNDGQVDAFVGNYKASTLWLGQKGTFTQVSSPVSNVTLAKAAAFIDFDNDGWKDLFITRFAADNAAGDILIYKNNKGAFEEVKGAFKTSILRDYAMPTAIADFNNDGLLDIYVGFPGERDFSATPRADQTLAVHGLFLNKGNFKFADVTRNIAKAFTMMVMPHGALASDFDMDGKVDLIVMDDQKNLSPIYKNTGNGKFVLKNNDISVMNYGFGMGIAAGDLNQDGYQDYLFSNATFNADDRLALFDMGRPDAYAASLRGVVSKGMRLFLNTKTGTFAEVTSTSGLTDTGEAAGGVTVVDYDNDGLQDIYLVNGLWSGSSRDDSIDSLFAKSSWLWLVNQAHLLDGQGDRAGDRSKSAFMRILMDEKVNGKTMSFAGYQRNRLFKNMGDGKFIEVGYLENVDSQADGYMSVVTDINRDGKADLVLRNCDPGAADHPYAPVEIYENRHANKNALWVSLKGIKSNRMGAGAKLTATINGTTYMREMIANNSAMQGEVAVHFGLGSATKVDKLVINWPSGTTTIHTDVGAGRQIFEENEKKPIAAF